MTAQQSSLILGESPEIRRAVRDAILEDPRLVVVGLPPNGNKVLVRSHANRSDLVIIDFELPAGSKALLDDLPSRGLKHFALPRFGFKWRSPSDGERKRTLEEDAVLTHQGIQILKRIYKVLGLAAPQELFQVSRSRSSR
jgi:hypothetical protein